MAVVTRNIFKSNRLGCLISNVNHLRLANVIGCYYPWIDGPSTDECICDFVLENDDGFILENDDKLCVRTPACL